MKFLLKLGIIGIIGASAFFISRSLHHFPKIKSLPAIKQKKEILMYEAKKISKTPTK